MVKKIPPNELVPDLDTDRVPTLSSVIIERGKNMPYESSGIRETGPGTKFVRKKERQPPIGSGLKLDWPVEVAMPLRPHFLTNEREIIGAIKFEEYGTPIFILTPRYRVSKDFISRVLSGELQRARLIEKKQWPHEYYPDGTRSLYFVGPPKPWF